MRKISYATPLDVVYASGIQAEDIVEEDIGTGDNTETEFSLDHKRVVEGSDKIYLDGTLKTRDTDYTINEAWGKITFASAPGTDVAIKGDYKYLPEGYTNTDLTDLITKAQDEVERWTRKKYTDSTSTTEYFPGRAKKISATGNITEGQYHDETEEESRLIVLSNYPVQEITSLQFLDDDGSVSKTLTENTDFHVWEDSGEIWLFNEKIPVGKNKKKVKIVYTYGYASVPIIVKELTAVLAAMRWLANMMGGSYDDVTSYSIPMITAAKGEPYMNMKACFDKLEKQKDRLLKAIGRSIITA